MCIKYVKHSCLTQIHTLARSVVDSADYIVAYICSGKYSLTFVNTHIHAHMFTYMICFRYRCIMRRRALTCIPEFVLMNRGRSGSSACFEGKSPSLGAAVGGPLWLWVHSYPWEICRQRRRSVAAIPMLYCVMGCKVLWSTRSPTEVC